MKLTGARYYILNGREPVVCDDFMEWARFFDNIDNRRVLQADVGDWWVSTVFLGMDHRFGDGPPLLFETMIFPRTGGERGEDVYCERCSTYDEAEAQHDRACEYARTELANVVKDRRTH